MIYSRWAYTYIPLANPSHETLELQMVNSNPTHFAAEIDPKQTVSKISVFSQKKLDDSLLLKTN